MLKPAGVCQIEAAGLHVVHMCSYEILLYTPGLAIKIQGWGIPYTFNALGSSATRLELVPEGGFDMGR